MVEDTRAGGDENERCSFNKCVASRDGQDLAALHADVRSTAAPMRQRSTEEGGSWARAVLTAELEREVQRIED